MKKYFALLITGLLVIGASGCGNKTTAQQQPPAEPATEVTAQAPTEISTQQQTAAVAPAAAAQQVAAATPIAVTGDSAASTASVADGSSASMPEAFAKPAAKEIQEALQNAGVYQGKIDGDIGHLTRAAIKKFQADNGLKVDGRVGPQTWAKLESHLNQSAPIASATTAMVSQ